MASKEWWNYYNSSLKKGYSKKQSYNYANKMCKSKKRSKKKQKSQSYTQRSTPDYPGGKYNSAECPKGRYGDCDAFEDRGTNACKTCRFSDINKRR